MGRELSGERTEGAQNEEGMRSAWGYLILLIKKESYTCVLSACIGFLFTCALCKAHKAHVYVLSLHALLQRAHV